MNMSLTKDWLYPTAFSVWGSEEYAAIDRVVKSGKFTMGSEVQAFEEEFAAFHNMKYGVMVNSGSSANLIAVATLFNLAHFPLHRGDPVFVPAIAWSTTYAPLVQYGLNLKLLDCDETWNAKYDPSFTYHSPDLASPDLCLIVGCSILGNSGYMAEWAEIASDLGALFIEDNCESMSALDPDGVRCGTNGIMNTFSFFYSHQISAIEGGMILTDDYECFELCRMLRAHGWSRDIKKPQDFDHEYDFHLFGYNVRPLEMHAAIAREQLKKYSQHREQRLTNVGLFRKLTEGCNITHQKLHGNPDPFGLSFQVYNNQTRAVLAHELRRKGIDCRLPTGGSFLKHKYGKPWADQQTPNADLIHATGMFLGNGALDLSNQIKAAVDIIRNVCGD